MVHPSGLLDNLAKIMPPNQITPSVAMALMIGGWLLRNEHALFCLLIKVFGREKKQL
jgi:hypothetical protein